MTSILRGQISFFKESFNFHTLVLLPESAARRPKLKLAPRTVKAPVNAPADAGRNASIFGSGKPRDEKDFESKSPGGEESAGQE